MISKIGGQEWVELDDQNIPESYASWTELRRDGGEGNGRLYISALALTKGDSAGESDPTSGPQVGDTRIWFTATPVTTVSLLSQQNGDSFQPFETRQGTSIHVLKNGVLSAQEMIEREEAANRALTWILRLVGAVIMFVGLLMVLRPLVVLADVLPFAGSLVGIGTAIVAGLLTIAGSMTVIGIAWLFYRPLLGITLLVIAAAAIFFVVRASRSQKQDAPEQLTEMDLA